MTWRNFTHFLHHSMFGWSLTRACDLQCCVIVGFAVKKGKISARFLVAFFPSTDYEAQSLCKALFTNVFSTKNREIIELSSTREHDQRGRRLQQLHTLHSTLHSVFILIALASIWREHETCVSLFIFPPTDEMNDVLRFRCFFGGLSARIFPGALNLIRVH